MSEDFKRKGESTGIGCCIAQISISNGETGASAILYSIDSGVGWI